MPVKSIIDVEVNDGSFNAYLEKFNAYRANLAKTPAQWAAAGAQTKAISGTTATIVAAMAAQTEMLGKIVSGGKQQEQNSRNVERNWLGIARNTRSAAANIRDATTSLLKWTGLTTVFSGLLGAGGLFGITRMASGVAAGRRSSLGAGVSYGEQRSFGANFGRLVDPDSFLGSVADARSDVTRRVGFYGAGLNERQLQGSSADIAVDLIRALKKIADTTDPKLYAQVISARQLGQFASPEDLRRLAGTSPGEIDQLARSYRSNQSTLGLDAGAQKAWQDFSTQMGRAGQQIENTFVKGLSPLIPGLEKLSEGVEKTVRSFLGSDAVKAWMEQAGAGLEKLAKYVGTQEFQNNVETFVSGVGKIAGAVGTLASWFGRGKAERDAEKHAEGFRTPDDLRQERADGKATAWDQFKRIFTPAMGDEAYIAEAAAKRGIDPKVAVAVARSEGLNKYVGDRGSSFGPYQLHYGGIASGKMGAPGLGDEFTKATGLDARNPDTKKQQIDFALDWAKKNGWGPWHGWKGDSQAGLNVKVENQTGGNATATINQLKGPQ